jgi:glycosyltransferase involved in cell wall biosynthesis
MTPPAKNVVFISTAVAQGLSGVCGGGELFAIELLRELKLRGWSITLVCPASSPMLADASLRDSVERCVLLDLSAKIKNPFLFCWIVLRWLLLVRGSESRLFYGNGFENIKWLALVPWVKKAATACHLQESFCEPYHAPRTRHVSRRIDRFFAISKAVRQEFHRGARVPLDRIILLPHGVPIHPKPEKTGTFLRDDFSIPPSAPFIVMAARTDALKGHETLLRAMPLVLARHPDAHLVMVGVQSDSPVEKELCARWKALIEEFKIGSSVRLEPYRTDVRRLMGAADLAIVPSTAEGFGRTAIEGMAEGTAVITSDAGGLADIIEPEVDGLRFPSGDWKALASAINRLLDDPALRARLAAAGRETAVRRYSTETMVDRIEQQLLEVQEIPQ